MPQYVEVVGVGTVEFPDGMSQEDMASALSQLPTPKAEAKPAPAAPKAEAKPATELAPGEEAVKGVKSGVSAVKSMWEGAGVAKDVGVATQTARALDLFTQIDKGVLNRSNLTPDKAGGDMSPVFRNAMAYLMSDEKKRQQLRDRATSELQSRKDFVNAAVKTIQQYQEDNKKNKGRTENLTDIEGIKDFTNWLSFNVGSGAVQMAPVMLAAITTGGPGAYLMGAGMELGGATQNRLEFILNKTKDEQDPEKRAKAIFDYVQKTQDTSLAQALASGAVDVLLGPVADVIKQPLKQSIREKTRKEIAKQAAKAVPRQVGEEGLAGGTQETIAIAAERALEEQTGAALTPENIKRVVNAAAAEAAGGGGVSAMTGAARVALGAKPEEVTEPRVEPTLEEAPAAAPAEPEAPRPTLGRLEAARRPELEGEPLPPPLTKMEAARRPELEVEPAPPVEPAAPVEDPRVQTLAQAYIQQGFMEDDATLLAQQDIAALEMPVTDAEGRAIQRQSAEDEARTMEGRAERTLLQMEGENVPTSEPPPFVTEPSTDQLGVPLPSGAEPAAGGLASPINRGLDAASRVVGELTGREETERAALEERQFQAERAAASMARRFNQEPYPDLGNLLGASWVRNTLAQNPTPDEYQDAAYARLEELNGQTPADAGPAFERRAPAAEPMGERPEAVPEPAAAPAVTEEVEAPPAAEAAKPVKSDKEKIFELQRTQPEAKTGDAITFNLPWVPGGYEVSGIVGNSVYMDKDGREVTADTPGAKRYVNVTYKVDGEQITNPFEIDTLRLNTIRFEEKPDLTKPKEKPRGAEAPKAVETKEERPAKPAEGATPAGLELEAGRRPELEVDPAVLTAVQRIPDEKLKQQLIAEFGATAAGEPRKRAPGGGREVSEAAKTKEERGEQAADIVNLLRDVQAEISAARKLERSAKGDVFGIVGQTAEEVAYREALRDLSLDVLRASLYKSAQKFKSRPIVAYGEAGKYIKSLKPDEQERAKALAEGKANFRALPPFPEMLSTPAQRKRAIEKIKTAEEEAAAEPVKEARPAKDVVAEAEEEIKFFTTPEAEEFRKRGEEARKRAEEKQPQEKTKWTDFNARLLAKAIPKSESMEAQFTEEEIADAIEDIADDKFDADEAKKMSFDDLKELTQAAMQLAAERHTTDTDKTFRQLNTLAGALAYIAQTGTPLDAGMAEALLTGENGELVKNVSLYAVKPPKDGATPTQAQKMVKGAFGTYGPRADRTGGVVFLDDSGKAESGLNNLTVLHEGVHAVTSMKLFYVQDMIAAGRQEEVDEKLLDGFDQLNELMAQANNTAADMMRNKTLPKEISALAAKDAFTDVHEFLAYGLTDANMKAFLLTVPGVGVKKSGLSRFISAILNLLQLGKAKASALRDLVIVSGKFMEAKTPSAASMVEAYEKSKRKLDSEAKSQRKESAKVEQKLKATESADEVVRQMGSLMGVAKNPKLWVDYLRVNYKNIATPVYKGYLAVLPTNVLVDLAEAFGIGNVKELNARVQKMHTFRTKMLRTVQDLATPWIQLNAKEQRKLAEVMHYSTDVQIDPTTDKSDPRLNARWNALDKKSKDIYVKIRDFYKNNYNLYRALLAQRVKKSGLNPTERTTLMDAIRESFVEGAKISPYFPFMRYGDYWVSFGKGVNKEFYMFESPGERDLFRERRAAELKRRDPRIEIEAGNDIGSMRSNLQGDSPRLKQTLALIDDLQSATPDAKAALKDGVFQLHLMAMPEASFRKQFIHRKGTTGYSGDALRNFIVSGTKFANQLPRVKYGSDIRNLMSAAEASLEGDPDRPKKGMVTTELGLRMKDELEPAPPTGALEKIARGVNRAAFVWLLTSVHSAANQLFSIANFTLPTLAKYHGWGAATAELTKTIANMYTQVGTTTLDKDGNVTFTPPTMMNNRSLRLTPVEQRAYQAMLDRGIADATRTYDLFLRKGEPSDTYNDKTAKVVNALGSLFHSAESLSREVTFMSAFRLNIRKMPFEDAVENAIHTVNESLFDYSPWNTPRALKSAPARIVTQFMKFPLFVTLYLARNARAMFKPMEGETRTAAAKALFGTLGITGLLAGTQGLPLFGTMMGIAQGLRNLMADDDEEIVLEEDDLMRWFRNVWLPETFGDVEIMGMNLAELIDSGVLNTATGYDFASGISLNNMWFRDAPAASSWKDSYATSIQSFLGPGVGLGESWMSAIDDINKGDTIKGFEKLLPGLVRGSLTAYRYSEEGAVDSALRPIKEADEFTNAQLLMQAAGFKSTGLAKVMEDNFAIRQMQQKIMQKRSGLISNLDRAATMGRDTDFDNTLEKIDEYNMKYPSPDLRIDYDDIKKAMERRRKALMQSERGMLIDPKFRDFEVLRERGLELIEKEAAE